MNPNSGGTEATRLVLAGLPRSGTTLLATLLAAQPHIHFATDYFSCFTTAHSLLGENWSAPLNDREKKLALAIVRDQFLRVRHPVLVTPEQFSSLDHLHTQVMRELAPANSRVVGHKLLLSARGLEHALTQSSLYLLVVLRDPRDSALSFLQRTGGGVEGYVDGWLATAKLARRHRHHPRLLTLRFEDLIQNPASTLNRLGDWLGLPLTHSVSQLEFRRGGADGPSAWHENSAFGDVRQRFDPAPLGRHMTAANSAVVRYADWITRGERERWGYLDTALPLPTRRERLEFRTLQAVHQGEERLQARLFRSTRWLRRHLPSLSQIRG